MCFLQNKVTINLFCSVIILAGLALGFVAVGSIKDSMYKLDTYLDIEGIIIGTYCEYDTVTTGTGRNRRSKTVKYYYADVEYQVNNKSYCVQDIGIGQNNKYR